MANSSRAGSNDMFPSSSDTRRLFFIPLYQWIEALLGLPLILGLASILTRILAVFLRPLLRRLTHEQDDRRLASIVWPLRLEVLALLIYWTSRYAASLLVRRFWGMLPPHWVLSPSHGCSCVSAM